MDVVDSETIIEMVRGIRDLIPSRSQKIVFHPCVRTNLQTEAKALKKVFTRHKKNRADTAAELVVFIKKTIITVTRIRKKMSDDGQFVANPKMLSTWLNQDGWLDDYGETEESVRKNHAETLICDCCGKPATIRNADMVWVCKDNYLANVEDTYGLNEITKKMLAKDPKKENETWRDWALRQMKGKYVPGLNREPVP